jgi:predicted DNA binding protein
MDKNEIATHAIQMKSKKDLLKLLNLIKKAEVEELGFDSSSYHPFTEKQLNFYCNPNHTFHRYRQFKIKKKSGGFRQITAPKTKCFMMMLSAVNEILRAMYTPSEYAMGFTDGRSVATNASIHLGMNYVFNTDLKDFFPSIHQARVWKRLQLAPFNFTIPIANLIAGLCAMKETHRNDDSTLTFNYVLPQGAPTSPIITNMICDKLDRRLAGLAKRFGLHYTRYADDITFSSMHNVYQNNSPFRKELERIITDQGFTINDTKTRLQKKGSRQEVTGIIVSDKLNVTRKYVQDIRNILYMWDRYGYNVAYSKFFPKYKAEKGHVKKGDPDLINVIEGKLLYLKMVKSGEDTVYQRLFERFCKLADKDNLAQNTNAKGVTYLETSSVSDFEKKNSTKVDIIWSDKGKRYACFMLNEKKHLVSVIKSLTIEEEKKKDLLAISSCRDKNNKPFWLIHRHDKEIIAKKMPKLDESNIQAINIDELNAELDSLLKT